MIHPITAQLKGYIVYADYRVDLQDFWSGKGPWLEKDTNVAPLTIVKVRTLLDNDFFRNYA